MYLFTQDSNMGSMRIASQAKSLKAWATQNPSTEEGTEMAVYGSQKKFREGFDYTLYTFTDGKLKKSNGQPVVELSRMFFDNRRDCPHFDMG